ncbi:methyl-accepting chemotaxis protein [Geoanaerobacter pelophilus]|uniref:Methyl-accepting chemotaxis protein n=1 Tax=Geoanaerobacter pelophilus TaxID=60036 RepID=A0ABQ0MLY4_9BACT|nr:methyl-accepting chemotaxis protein [Geoanaerobacter pelophilus]GAW68096.1 methyl-accepting chemotaxis protein [Geoanaerobacter pelophilus]
MTIKAKLILNACIVLIAVGAVSVSSFISMTSIKGKLSYLTEKSTPYQVRTVEFQRALQGATADLIKVGAAHTDADYAAAKKEAEKSLDEVQNTLERLEKISGEKFEASTELNGIAQELFATMAAKLRSEKESSEARAVIVQKAQDANARIRDLENKVRSLQQSSSTAYSKANEDADKLSKKLASIETLKVSLKDLQFIFYDILRTPEKKALHDRFAGTVVRIQQNGNIKNNKAIGSGFAAFLSKANAGIKARTEGADSNHVDALLKDANAALSEVWDSIEDEVDKSQLQVSNVSARLPGYVTKANAAVNVLSTNSEMVSYGKSLESLSSRLFLATTEKELDAIAADFNQQYQKLSAAEKSVESLLKTAGTAREIKILRDASLSLSGIRDTVFMRNGILEKLRQKMQLEAKAESAAVKLRDIVTKQAEKGQQTVSVAQEGQEAAIGTVNRTIRYSMGLIIVIALASAVIGTLVGMWIYRSITTPIQQLITAAEEVAGGNLAVNLTASRNDEVGQVQGAMSRMLVSIRDVVGRIGEATDTLAGSSVKMAETAGALETGAERQASRVDDSAATMAQMSQTTIDVARNTADTANAADTMKEIAGEGKNEMQLTAKELQAFADSFTETSHMVEELGGQSAQISEIGTLIRDIADQTNLLALNAAIEAARAGEQGRGFAVVADSVRQLAERTQTATAEITETVKNMQGSVGRSVAKMGEEREAVGTILARVNTTVGAIERIAQYVEQVNDMVRRIATATEQQSAASREVSGNVDEIAMLTREVRASCSGIRESSDGLSRLAGELNVMVSWFRV